MRTPHLKFGGLEMEQILTMSPVLFFRYLKVYMISVVFLCRSDRNLIESELLLISCLLSQLTPTLVGPGADSAFKAARAPY